jgi:hypothetical protein
VTVVVSKVGTTFAEKEVVSESIESNEVSNGDDAGDGLVGVVMG